jgi:hypothetical protein
MRVRFPLPAPPPRNLYQTNNPMKTSILASALVLTLLLGLTPTADAGGRRGSSNQSGPANSAAAAKAKAEAAAREQKVNQVKADLKVAIANDPTNAAKYTAAAVQILGIDTKTRAGQGELSSIQATANAAVRRTDSYKSMTRAQKNSTIASIITESRAAVGTAPTFATITSNVAPTNPLNFPNTLEISNPLITASVAGILGDNTAPAGSRAAALFAGLGFPSGTNFTTNPGSDGTISIIVNPPVVSNPSPQS